MAASKTTMQDLYGRADATSSSSSTPIIVTGAQDDLIGAIASVFNQGPQPRNPTVDVDDDDEGDTAPLSALQRRPWLECYDKKLRRQMLRHGFITL